MLRAVDRVVNSKVYCSPRDLALNKSLDFWELGDPQIRATVRNQLDRFSGLGARYQARLLDPFPVTLGIDVPPSVAHKLSHDKHNERYALEPRAGAWCGCGLSARSAG